MTAEDVGCWAGEIADGDSVRCSECGGVAPLADWREGEVYCELCGEHPAVVCPLCDERFDTVYASRDNKPPFVVVR